MHNNISDSKPFHFDMHYEEYIITLALGLTDRVTTILVAACHFCRGFKTFRRSLLKQGEDSMMAVDPLASATKETSQVRIHLSSKHPDISIPGNPGPILVNTS